MINLARQAFANPFLSTAGASFQPGAVSALGRCPCCGNTVGVANTIQPQTAGLSPWGVGASQQSGVVPNQYGLPQIPGFGQTNPIASQFTTGVPQNVNPFTAQLMTNWPVSGLSQQGFGGRAGFGGGQQFGYNDPNVIAGLGNTATAGDPINSLFSHQFACQQQLPIRSLFGGQQGLGAQGLIPGIASPINQWADPYRAFIEAQLISQLTNPLYQLQRAYGGVPEVNVPGVTLGAGQQFNPFFANVPFYG